jgi:putative ABC transport system permease protein
MLKNYLKIAWRSILKQKGYSFITISGLAIGMACCIFLLLWVQDELSYDKFHKNADTIFRVEVEDKKDSGSRYAEVPCALAPAIKEAVPEARNVTRVFSREMMRLQYGENSFYESNVNLVDPSFFRIFSFPLLKGDPETVLKQPYSMALAEAMAAKYFGKEDPVGKTVLLNGRHAFTVTGVFRDAPANSTAIPEILIPMDFMAQVPGEYDLGWKEFCWTTWVQLGNKTDALAVANKLARIFDRNIADFPKRPVLIPLTAIRLDGDNIKTVYILTTLAIFILLLACINFINLATARSSKRAREIGVRKVVGAVRKNIMGQFFCESILLTMIALVAALIMVMCLLPVFNHISEKTVAPGSLFSWNFILCILGIAILTGVAAGSYPAVLLSLCNPVKVLKGALPTGARSGWLRKILVITQFSLSIILLIGTMIIYQQLHYLRNKAVGYDRERLVYIPMADDIEKSYSLFKDALQRDPGIGIITGTATRPTRMGRGISQCADWDGRNQDFNPSIDYGQVDMDYTRVMKIPMVAGRTFSEEISSDRSSAVIVNETFMKITGVQSVVGKRFIFSGRPGLRAFQGTIIGVMKDFHYRGFHRKIGPLVLFAAPDAVSYIVLRLPAGKTAAAIETARSTWRKVFSSAPFSYKFFEEDFDQMFKADERLENIIRVSSLLAILISCLGLFGLASFMVEQRTKEIGIRKVLGATANGVAYLLSKEFFIWILVSNLIACPAAYFLASKWLEGYPYKISIHYRVFGLGVLLTLALAFLTVGRQTWKAARANPVQCIKYE